MRKRRVFINGFGRIGRAALRIMIEDPTIEVVGINDIYDFRQMAGLFTHDSIYGTYHDSVSLLGNILSIGTYTIPLFNIAKTQELKLDNVDVLLQCTGIFLSKQANTPYLKNGAKKVLISAPADEDIPTYIMDVNHQSYQGEKIISNSSCSANAIIPIVTILQERYGVLNLSMSMFHAYTAYQKLLDVKHYSKDIRRARSATQNIQPLMSSAASESEKFFPHLRGKLYAKSIRVPVAACTLYDLTFSLKQKSNREDINQLFVDKCHGPFKQIVAIADKNAVSSDFIANPHGAIIDRDLTQVLEGDLVKIFAWQDNEYGYAYQLIRMLKHIS
jgi:glyceraldehyde 3-phosphate dehydrogenase